MTPAARVHRASELCAASLAALCWALALPARAHEAPAEPPDFAPVDCIEIVDKAEQELLHIEYSLRYDDVEFGLGDIPVPDAKTHQFFAFRGSLIPRGFGYQLYSFDPALELAPELPLWITIDDIKRAAEASSSIDGTAFTGETLPPGGVLQDRAEFDQHWLRITEDDARVPITIEQGQAGVDWDLAQVEPGLYSVVAYIFSPPYNGWAARPGFVKIVGEGSAEEPAARIEPVQGYLYTGHGRRVRACIDAPAGSRLRTAFRVEERPEQGWTEWLEERDVTSGSLELCFHPPPDLTGSLRLRFELEAPDGTTVATYSRDTVTALRGDAECVPSDKLCCDPATGGPAVDAGATDGSAGAGSDATTGQSDAGRAPDARAATRARGPDDDHGGGCAAASQAAPRRLYLLVLIAVVLLRRAGRRPG